MAYSQYFFLAASAVTARPMNRKASMNVSLMMVFLRVPPPGHVPQV